MSYFVTVSVMLTCCMQTVRIIVKHAMYERQIIAIQLVFVLCVVLKKRTVSKKRTKGNKNKQQLLQLKLPVFGKLFAGTLITHPCLIISSLYWG